jgi:hypothetical protein
MKRPKRSTTGLNLQDELEARRDCRYGLRGVAIRVEGHDELYRIYSTAWAAGKELRIKAYPASGPEPVAVHCIDPEEHGSLSTEHIHFHTVGCYANPEYPPGMLFKLSPSQCTLAEEWPVVCCRPSVRRKKA